MLDDKSIFAYYVNVKSHDTELNSVKKILDDLKERKKMLEERLKIYRYFEKHGVFYENIDSHYFEKEIKKVDKDIEYYNDKLKKLEEEIPLEKMTDDEFLRMTSSD